MIFRIGYVWDETPANVESQVAKVDYFNLDFDHNNFEELSRGYIADSVALRTVLVFLRLCYNNIHFLECAKL